MLIYNKKNYLIKVFILILTFLTLFSYINVFASDGVNDKRTIPTIQMDNDGNITEDSLGALKSKQNSDVWNELFIQYGDIIAGFSGIAALTMIAVFINNLMKLAVSATNPADRSRATTGILWSGIATAGLGAVTLFVGFFYNAI